MRARANAAKARCEGYLKKAGEMWGFEPSKQDLGNMQRLALDLDEAATALEAIAGKEDHGG